MNRKHDSGRAPRFSPVPRKHVGLAAEHPQSASFLLARRVPCFAMHEPEAGREIFKLLLFYAFRPSTTLLLYYHLTRKAFFAL
jgi:hypothetical protein